MSDAYERIKASLCGTCNMWFSSACAECEKRSKEAARARIETETVARIADWLEANDDPGEPIYIARCIRRGDWRK